MLKKLKKWTKKSSKESKNGLNDVQTDAAAVVEESSGVQLFYVNERQIADIRVDDLIPLEKDLSIFEKIGVIFLTYGSDPSHVSAGLQSCLNVLRPGNSDTSFIEEWASRCEKHQVDWREMLVESLCLVQAYHVTQKLGLIQKSLEEKYIPYRPEISLKVNAVLKALFLTFESLEIEEAKKFQRDGLPEIMIFQLITLKKLVLEPRNECNVDQVLTFLVSIGRKDLKEVLETAVRLYKDTAPQKSLENSIQKASTDSSKSKQVEKAPDRPAFESDRYEVRRRFCGYLLVINQETFTRDPSIPGLREYNKRVGTEVDCEALKRTFETRGYEIVVEKNLPHTKMVETLQNIVRASIPYDSLVVCILSHGEEGVVIAANCVPVPTTTIQSILTSSELINKPKMLIIQACQGGSPQPLVQVAAPEGEIEADGTIPSVSSPYADLLMAFSTIRGFASMRDRKEGTWYIQALCQAIDKYGDSVHVVDLLVKVNYEVSQNRATIGGRIIGQVPETNITLRRNFYLPKKEDV